MLLLPWRFTTYEFSVFVAAAKMKETIEPTERLLRPRLSWQPSVLRTSCPWWRSRTWTAAPFWEASRWSWPGRTSALTPRWFLWRKLKVGALVEPPHSPSPTLPPDRSHHNAYFPTRLFSSNYQDVAFRQRRLMNSRPSAAKWTASFFLLLPLYQWQQWSRLHDLNDNAAGLLPFRPHFLFDFHPYRRPTTLKQALCSSVALQVTQRLFLPCLNAMACKESRLGFDISDFDSSAGDSNECDTSVNHCDTSSSTSQAISLICFPFKA